VISLLLDMGMPATDIDLAVLLAADAAIGGEQHVEACLLSGIQQLAIAERVPAFELRRMHSMLRTFAAR
jgi:hypothetical protein